MAEAPVVELNELVDGQKVGVPAIVFLMIATLAMMSDGFDLAAIGFVGPELIKQWHVLPSDLAPLFIAGIVGLLAGAPLFGYFGDRSGRRKAILVGLCAFGGLTLASMAATSLPQLLVLRFLTGVGLGGVIPNVIALAAEVAPKRLRGLFIVIVNFGVPAGIALPGFVAAGLVPSYGWPVLFLVGGLLPLAVAVVAYFGLAESIKYLARQPGRTEEMQRIARGLRPDLAIGAATRFVTASPGATVPNGSVKGLFAGGLAAITPLLWIALAANQMSNFFSLTWLPTLLQSTGASTTQAGLSASLFSIGGIAGGLCLTFVIDRLGVIPMVILFFVGAPLIAAIGMSGLSPAEHNAIIAGAGFCVTGINFAMGATLGMIYPTPIRAMGTGWAQAMGRVGALLAPIIGGALLARHYPTQELLLAPAFVLGIGALACAIMAILCVRRFHGYRLSEFSAAELNGRILAPAPSERMTPLA